MSLGVKGVKREDVDMCGYTVEIGPEMVLLLERASENGSLPCLNSCTLQKKGSGHPGVHNASGLPCRGEVDVAEGGGGVRSTRRNFCSSFSSKRVSGLLDLFLHM